MIEMTVRTAVGSHIFVPRKFPGGREFSQKVEVGFLLVNYVPGTYVSSMFVVKVGQGVENSPRSGRDTTAL